MPDSTPLIRLTPPGSGNHAVPPPHVRIVGFGPSGSGTPYFRPLLAPGVEVWSAVYPGRESRSHVPFATEVWQLAEELLLCVEGLPSDDVPVVLLGHSLGVLVAVEVAVRLLRSIDLVCLSAGHAPTSRRQGTDERMRRIVADDDALRGWLGELGGTPAEVLASDEFMALYLPVLRADLTVSLNQQRTLPDVPPLDAPMLLLCGDSDPVVTLQEMQRWGALTTAAVTSKALPGGHHALLRDPPGTLALITGALETSTGGTERI